MTSMSDTIIHSATIVSDRTATDDGWVLFRDARVAARGVGAGWQQFVSPQAAVVDAAGSMLTPGFVDSHVHGGGGAAFTDGPEAIATALAAHRRYGTTRSVISLVTATMPDLHRQIVDARTVMSHDPLVVGIHLEGPFLAASHKGAHAEALLIAPSDAAVAELMESAGSALRQVTLAPELAGGRAAIARLVAGGVRVAIGHTAADYAGAMAAFDLGASILTHAFNGMKGIHHRAPGPVTAAIDSTQVDIELIADGTHVLGPVARLLSRSAGDRVCLVTDAMAAAASLDGEYMLGSLAVRVADGVARLVDGGSIAGSTLTMDRALAFAVTVMQMDIVDAVASVTQVPARALGLQGQIGSLAAGFPADAVLLGGGFEVLRVWADGVETAAAGPLQFSE